MAAANQGMVDLVVPEPDPDRLAVAKDQIRYMVNNMSESDFLELMDWVNDEYMFKRSNDTIKNIITLEEIGKRLRRSNLLVKGQLPSDNVRYPLTGQDSDCNADNTTHLDCFLYDDKTFRKMVKTGEFKEGYCENCKSSDSVKPLKIISHSLSIDQLEFMFTRIIPLKKQVRGFKVLDIGSRLGSVIFAASLFGEGKCQVAGIELNRGYINLQQEIIIWFMLDNITPIDGDVRNQTESISSANLIVMNNVFTFFMNETEQRECWVHLKTTMRRGTKLIHHPDIKSVTAHLGFNDDFFDEWLEEIEIDKREREMFAKKHDMCLEDLKSLHYYVVL